MSCSLDCSVQYLQLIECSNVLQLATVGDKIKFPLRLKKSFESRYKAAKQVSGTSDFSHKSRLQLRVKSP